MPWISAQQSATAQQSAVTFLDKTRGGVLFYYSKISSGLEGEMPGQTAGAVLCFL